MLVQAKPQMATTATNPDQVMARQHSQDSTIFHLSPTRSQTIHVQAQAHATFPPMFDGKDVRLQRLEMLQESLKNEATSSNDPRSRVYATLYERTINPELRSHHFLDIPVTRQGLMGGRGESSSYEINEKREEISQAQTRVDNLQSNIRSERNSLRYANDDEKDAISNRINELNQSLVSERMTLYRLQDDLSDLLRNA